MRKIPAALNAQFNALLVKNDEFVKSSNFDDLGKTLLYNYA
jgi:hypothetical protein